MSIDFIGNRDDPDYVYYNALIINNTVQTTQSTADPAIVFQDTRDIPALRDASLYEVSVEKLTLDGAVQNLPIFIPQIQTPVTNINQTVYTITFSWTDGAGAYYQDTQTLQWTPEDVSQFAPVPPLNTPVQIETPYYYMYTFQHWVDIVNTALRTAYNNVVTSAGIGFGGTLCPFFSFDPERKIFILSQDVNTAVVPYGVSLPPPYSTPSPVGSSSAGVYLANEFSFVGYNTNFEALINNLPTVYYADQTLWGGGLYYPENVVTPTVTSIFPEQVSTAGANAVTILTTNTGRIVNPFTGIVSATAPTYIITPEEKSSLESLWSPVQSFVLTTTQIPVLNELVSNPIPLGTANLGTAQQGGNAFSRILIETPLETIATNWFSYEPKTPTFSGMSPTHLSLRTIDFRLWWRNRLTNSLTPVTLYNLGNASVRLLFKKRGVV